MTIWKSSQIRMIYDGMQYPAVCWSQITNKDIITIASMSTKNTDGLVAVKIGSKLKQYVGLCIISNECQIWTQHACKPLNKLFVWPLIDGFEFVF